MFFTEHYYGGSIEDEMGRSFVCGRDKKAYKITVGRGHLKDLGVDGRIVIKWALYK